MQDRYIGDVGDFGKYGLLRILAGLDGGQPLKLGVVWYLYPNESHNEDGKYISYLQKNDPFFRDCDPQLYHELRASLFDDLGLIENNRNTGMIERSRILPKDTVFYSLPLSYQVGLMHEKRAALRVEWVAGTQMKTASADLVFLDPDNGMECKITRTKKKGPKYVFWDDLDAFVARGQSAVVYHHLSRKGTHPNQVENMRGRMNERFKNGFKTSAVIYKRGNGRAYFVVTAPQHEDLLGQRLKKMSAGLWNRHFDFTYI